MSNESTNLNLNDDEDHDNDFDDEVDFDDDDSDSCDDICPECMALDLHDSLSESESEIAAFLAKIAANSPPDHKMCSTCKALIRAIMSLYENREDEPEGLLLASAILSLHQFHANDAEMMAKDILADVVEQMNRTSE